MREDLDLLDWRRRVADIYGEVRRRGPSETTWRWWRDERDELFATHPSSPLPAARRPAFTGLPVYPYDPDLRLGPLDVHDAEPIAFGIAHGADGVTPARRVGTIALPLGDVAHPISVFRIDAYGDGLFVPLRDATNGDTTYGGGRYLLDTVKSADLGGSGGQLEIDLNFAYHPSCVHDPTWSCPLAPAEDRVGVRIEGGERLADVPASSSVVEIAT
ncbi:MAG: DUF1684 domain-containing protein [Nitriliruptor sp.]|uniref:DUF1684 domain-containing protein n=1 Tax=Nitriliruptor sp. TaxID=2448056 RepID=UPI0034A07A5B